MNNSAKKGAKKKREELAPKLSAQDISCRRYVEMGEEISRLEKERAKIRAQLEHRGTHSTRNFVVTVERRPELRAPNKAEFLKLFPDGANYLKQIFKTFVTVKPKSRGDL